MSAKMMSPNDLYSWNTRQRKPSGANTAQPIQNSGQPNTSNLSAPKGIPNNRGVSKPQFNDMGIYGGKGTWNRDEAERKRSEFSGNPLQKGPNRMDPNARAADSIQLLGQSPSPSSPISQLYNTPNQPRGSMSPMRPESGPMRQVRLETSQATQGVTPPTAPTAASGSPDNMWYTDPISGEQYYLASDMLSLVEAPAPATPSNSQMETTREGLAFDPSLYGDPQPGMSNMEPYPANSHPGVRKTTSPSKFDPNPAPLHLQPPFEGAKYYNPMAPAGRPLRTPSSLGGQPGYGVLQPDDIYESDFAHRYFPDNPGGPANIDVIRALDKARDSGLLPPRTGATPQAQPPQQQPVTQPRQQSSSSQFYSTPSSSTQNYVGDAGKSFGSPNLVQPGQMPDSPAAPSTPATQQGSTQPPRRDPYTPSEDVRITGIMDRERHNTPAAAPASPATPPNSAATPAVPAPATGDFYNNLVPQNVQSLLAKRDVARLSKSNAATQSNTPSPAPVTPPTAAPSSTSQQGAAPASPATPPSSTATPATPATATQQPQRDPYATSPAWAGVPDEFRQRYEFNRWRGEEKASSMTPEQAAEIYRKDFAPNNKELEPLDPSLGGEYASWTSDPTGSKPGGRTANPPAAPRRAAPPQPEDKYSADAFRKAFAGADTRMVPGGNVTRSDKAEYEDALGGLSTSMLPGGRPGGFIPPASHPIRDAQSMANDPLTVFDPALGRRIELPALSPERLAELQNQFGQDAEALKAAVESNRKQLGFTGAMTNEDRVSDLNRRADTLAENTERADALRTAPGGLKYRQSSTGFGTAEQGDQATSDFRNMANWEKAQRDAYTTQNDAMMDKYRQERPARNKADAEKYGITDAAGQPSAEKMEETKRESSRLGAEYATFQKANPGRMKYVDFIQAKVNNGEIPYGSDVLKVISKNYNRSFTPKPIADGDAEEQEKLYQTGKTGVQNWRADRQKSRDAGYAPDMNQAQREGLDRRRATAARQGELRAEEARLVAQGMNPVQARQAMGQAAATQRYYDAETARTLGPSQAQAQADMYKTDALMGDNKLARKEASEQREFEQGKAERDAYATNVSEALAQGGDINDPNSPAGRHLATKNAAQKGQPLPDPIGDARKAGGNRTLEQSNLLVDSTAGTISQRVNAAEDPTAIATVHADAKAAGLSNREQLQVIGRVFNKPGLDNPKNASALVDSIFNSMVDDAEKAGTDSKSDGTNSFNASYNTSMATYKDTIALLMENVPEGMRKDLFNKLGKRLESGRYYSSSNSQKAINALQILFGLEKRPVNIPTITPPPRKPTN